MKGRRQGLIETFFTFFILEKEHANAMTKKLVKSKGFQEKFTNIGVKINKTDTKKLPNQKKLRITLKKWLVVNRE